MELIWVKLRLKVVKMGLNGIRVGQEGVKVCLKGVKVRSNRGYRVEGGLKGFKVGLYRVNVEIKWGCKVFVTDKMTILGIDTDF